MIPGLWQKLFIVAAVLLVVSLILGVGSWQQLNAIRTQLNAVKLKMDTLQAERDQMLDWFVAYHQGEEKFRSDNEIS